MIEPELIPKERTIELPKCEFQNRNSDDLWGKYKPNVPKKRRYKIEMVLKAKDGRCLATFHWWEEKKK